MSEFPKTKPESFETQRDRKYADKLRDMAERGVSDLERIALISEWQDKEQELMPHHNPEGEIKYALRIAEMKLSAGLSEQALKDFYDAINLAIGHRRDDLADKIRNRISKLSE